ncbi:hypothetical protein IU453_24830 [Nocardia cyriacigeorgica]|uniref:hypothetical protein n=1 Tax=Nocardia cyriacigeorgica TaxID=135487 RepID=UPI00189333C7|nr:hypothetical protein [Nocardia cyriacigeorgica]MBF6319979.1 hypothetical protein [Nocardia cyriacigeorgica]MBF6534397.1 hypothetical protein [Nocardia cyriacigeorgica]
MTEYGKRTRAIALLYSRHDPVVFEALMRRHRLRIVYTVYTDVAAVLAALIAVQHALDHLADAVAVPHLGALEPDTPWWVITEAADLITGAGQYPRRSAVLGPTEATP